VERTGAWNSRRKEDIAILTSIIPEPGLIDSPIYRDGFVSASAELQSRSLYPQPLDVPHMEDLDPFCYRNFDSPDAGQSGSFIFLPLDVLGQESSEPSHVCPSLEARYAKWLSSDVFSGYPQNRDA